MSPPPTPPRRSSESPVDSDVDTELVWPPPEEERFATENLDLETRRVMSIREAATGLDVMPLTPATEHREPRLAPPEAADMFAPADAPTFAAPAPRESDYALPGRQWTAAAPRRFSTRSIVAALAVVVVVQAIVIIAVLVRGRAPRAEERASSTTGSQVGAARVPADMAAAFALLADAPPADAPVQLPAPVQPTEAAPPSATHGRLLVRSDPTGSPVVIDGRRRGTTPLAVDGLTAGSHRVQLGTTGVSIEQTVTIEAGSTTTLVVPMNVVATTTGWLSLTAPIALQIFEKGRLLGTTADGPIRLGTGTHSIELVNEPLGYRGEESVTVDAGQMVSLRPQIPGGILHVNAQPWANVWVDGEPAGETPLANINVTLGPHEIRFRHPSFGEQVRQVVVSAREPARVSVSMKP
jgi:hypothetical protein